MNRRLFLCSLGLLLNLTPATSRPAVGGTVRLTSYLEPSLIGGLFEVVGRVQPPEKVNQHYREGEVLYRIAGGGRILDVYIDEVETVC